MADDNRSGDEDEVYESRFQWLYDTFLPRFPLWDVLTLQRTCGMANKATPPELMAEIYRTTSDLRVNASRFSLDVWDAVFGNCVPDMRNDADRYTVVTLLRNYFIVEDNKAEELMYRSGDVYDAQVVHCFQHSTSKLKTLVPQAQVSATV